jgi:histone H3/H4
MMRSAFIESMAGALGIRVTEQGAQTLAYKLDERLMAIIQSASTMMQHCNRSTLTADDITAALRMEHLESLVGYSSADAATFKFARAKEATDTFYVEDPVVSVEAMLQATTAAIEDVPKEPVLSVHWLSVGGVQPLLKQNPTPAARAAALASAALIIPVSHAAAPVFGPEGAAASSLALTAAAAVSAAGAGAHAGAGADAMHRRKRRAGAGAGAVASSALVPSHASAGGDVSAGATSSALVAATGDGSSAGGGSGSSSGSGSGGESALTAASTAASLRRGGQLLRASTGHSLSREQQQLLVQVTSAVASTDPARARQALTLVRCNVHAATPLVPYLVQHIVHSVTAHAGPAATLLPLLSLTHALLASPHPHLDVYLDHLLPALLALLLGRSLGASPADDHWRVRDAAATLLRDALSRYGDEYPSLLPRAAQALAAVLSDGAAALPSVYGALRGLTLSGARTLQALVAPAAPRLTEALNAHLAPLRPPAAPRASAGAPDSDGAYWACAEAAAERSNHGRVVSTPAPAQTHAASAGAGAGTGIVHGPARPSQAAAAAAAEALAVLSSSASEPATAAAIGTGASARAAAAVLAPVYGRRNAWTRLEAARGLQALAEGLSVFARAASNSVLAADERLEREQAAAAVATALQLRAQHAARRAADAASSGIAAAATAPATGAAEDPADAAERAAAVVAAFTATVAARRQRTETAAARGSVSGAAAAAARPEHPALPRGCSGRREYGRRSLVGACDDDGYGATDDGQNALQHADKTHLEALNRVVWLKASLGGESLTPALARPTDLLCSAVL